MFRRVAAVLVILIGTVTGCNKEQSQRDSKAPSVSTARFQESARDGEALFKQYCSACHPDGGNVSDSGRTLYGSVLKKNRITTAEDIVRIMRNPKSRMIRFDASTLSDKDARAIAEYVLRAFR